jgi:hypothetical protein
MSSYEKTMIVENAIIRNEAAQMNESLIPSLQAALKKEKIDGWLFYGFRGSDPIAEHILGLDSASFATRRWFYFVPATGEPQRIVHAIETHTLDSLPGQKHIYLPWQQLQQHLKDVLAFTRCGDAIFADEYDPLCFSRRRRHRRTGPQFWNRGGFLRRSRSNVRSGLDCGTARNAPLCREKHA